MKTKGVIYCGLFTALIAVGAFIKIPIPVVPFTLQYLFTMLAGLLLGSRLGTVSVLSYMLLGLAGLPIFSEGGGLWYVFKPSFGYIIGFAVGTFVTGWIAEHMEKKTIARYLLANLAGLFCLYVVMIAGNTRLMQSVQLFFRKKSHGGTQIDLTLFFHRLICMDRLVKFLSRQRSSRCNDRKTINAFPLIHFACCQNLFLRKEIILLTVCMMVCRLCTVFTVLRASSAVSER